MWPNEFITYNAGFYLHLIGSSKYTQLLELYELIKKHR